MAASIFHGSLQVNLAYELRKATDHRIISELSILIEDKEYKPDICVYPYQELDWEHDTVKTTEIPLLAIEVLSPTQGIQELIEKKDTYLKAGIQSCWIVVPFPQSVTVFSKGSRQTFTKGDLVDPLFKITIPLKNLFR